MRASVLGKAAAFVVFAVLVGIGSAAATAQESELKQEYGVYSIAPKNPKYGIGAIMMGYFDRSGTQLKSALLICRSRFEVSEEDLKNCKSKQSTMSGEKKSDKSFDITVAIKQLLGAEAKAGLVDNVTLTVKDACLFELDLEQAEEQLEERPLCLELTAKQRKQLSKKSLAERLKSPGEYNLIWQTMRALYATYVYKMEFKSNASLKLKAEAAELIKGNSGAISGEVTNANTLELKGDGMLLGLAPRYYEQWFKTASESRVAETSVEKIIRDRDIIIVGTSRETVRGVKKKDDVDVVSEAAEDTDKKLKELLAKKAK